MIDFHVHSKHSIDSHAEMEDMVRAGIGAGLKAMCFTTHIDLNPFRRGIDPFMRIDGKLRLLDNTAVGAYLDEIAELRARYSGEIQLWSGFELSYMPHYDAIARDFVVKHPVDFVLGAVHCLENISVTASSEADGYLRSTAPSAIAEDFCDKTIAIARSNIFSTIAHVDGIKKYARRLYGTHIDRELEKLFPKVFDEIAKAGVGIEINTSAMRKGYSDFYPSRNILEMAREAGVRVNSIGSDAHRAGDVGYKLDEALTLIREVGIGVGEPLRGFLGV
jgi:histidinol-phosphatase (PHP family)